MFRGIERVGFAGLGAMGAGIAQRLLDAGYEVVGWNRTKAKAEPLLEAGMGWAESPRELAASVDVLFTMLTNTAAIEEIAEPACSPACGPAPCGPTSRRSRPTPASRSPSASPRPARRSSTARSPAARRRSRPARCRSWSAATARRSTTSRACCTRSGPKVTYIGPNGQAILTKVAINLALVVSVTAFAEGVALVEKAGVDRAAVVDAVLKSVIASPVLGYRAPLLVDDAAVFADVELQQKDLVLAQELARRLGAAVPTCAATSEMLNAARSSESADRDFLVSVHEAYRRIGGMQA